MSVHTGETSSETVSGILQSSLVDEFPEDIARGLEGLLDARALPAGKPFVLPPSIYGEDQTRGPLYSLSLLLYYHR